MPRASSCDLLTTTKYCAPEESPRSFRAVFIGLVSCLFGACVAQQQVRATPDELLAKEWGARELDIMKVRRETNPVKGHLRIVVPDDDRIRPFAAQVASEAFNRHIGGRELDYLAGKVRLDLRAMSEALVQSKEFERMTIVVQNDTRNPEMADADFVVWFQIRQSDDTERWLAHWKVRHVGNEEVVNAGIDRGAPEGTPRYTSFVQSVREAALRLGGAPIIAGAPAVYSTERSNRVAGNGSGIVVDAKGHVLTNHHVVATCREIRVVDGAGQSVKATLTVSDAVNDLALIAASLQLPTAASFRESRVIQQGEAVLAAGYPLASLLGSGLAITTGTIAALAGPQNDSRYIQFTAPIQPGNSGGPVLDMAGDVVGVTKMTFNPGGDSPRFAPQNVNFAVKTGVVRTFLESNSIEPRLAAGAANQLSATDVAARARQFTVKVECRR